MEIDYLVLFLFLEMDINVIVKLFFHLNRTNKLAFVM